MRPQINIMWGHFYAGVYLHGCAEKYTASQIRLYWGSNRFHNWLSKPDPQIFICGRGYFWGDLTLSLILMWWRVVKLKSGQRNAVKKSLQSYQQTGGSPREDFSLGFSVRILGGKGENHPRVGIVLGCRDTINNAESNFHFALSSGIRCGLPKFAWRGRGKINTELVG